MSVECVRHGKKINKFCKECEVFMCEECVGHEGHNIVELKKCLEEYEDELPCIDVLKLLLPTIKEKLEYTNNEGELFAKKYEYINNKIKVEKELTEDKDDALEKDFSLLEKINKYINDAELIARTYTLKETCKNILEILSNTEENIENEVKTVEDNIQKLKEEIDEIIINIQQLSIQKKQLELLMNVTENNNANEDDTEYKLCYLMLKNQGILKSDYRINVEQNDYKAFPFVEEIFNIKEVMEQELLPVSHGIQVSEPIYLNFNLYNETQGCGVSVSHNGILAICSECTEREVFKPDKCVVHLTNLFTQQCVEYKVDNWISTGFYDDKLVCVVRGRGIFEVRVKDIFKTPHFKTFIKLFDDFSSQNSDLSRVHVIRKFYSANDYSVYSFNVDTHEIEKFHSEETIRNVASTLGLNIGVECVFSIWRKNSIYSINNNKTRTKLCSESCEISAVLPSSKYPLIIHNAALQIGGSLFYNDNWINIEDPLLLDSSSSLARLYKDVFLLYDMYRREWVLSRIIIP